MFTSAIQPERHLPEAFQFSQSSLQDYVDCRRRFQLKYILRYSWPAVQSEPALENERFQQQGTIFHLLAHQLFAGVSESLLADFVQDEPLKTWWINLLELVSSIDSEGAVKYPEISLTTPLNNFRLLATYDLIIFDPEKGFKIFDWKTSPKKPGGKWLHERLQTRIYPYILSRAGSILSSGRNVPNESIEMIYWYAAFKDEPVRYQYSDAQYKKDHAYLDQLISEIGALGSDEFSLTADERRCLYCNYRSLCERGERAGSLEMAEELISGDSMNDVSFDYDQIAEIDY